MRICVCVCLLQSSSPDYSAHLPPAEPFLLHTLPPTVASFEGKKIHLTRVACICMSVKGVTYLNIGNSPAATPLKTRTASPSNHKPLQYSTEGWDHKPLPHARGNVGRPSLPAILVQVDTTAVSSWVPQTCQVPKTVFGIDPPHLVAIIVFLPPQRSLSPGGVI